MKKINLNENTSVGLPLKNLFSLIAAIVIGSYFAFGVLERLNNLETADIIKGTHPKLKNLDLTDTGIDVKPADSYVIFDSSVIKKVPEKK